ncbi:MAG: DUF6323 family protein [Lachnospiraceae bacterium]
MKNMMELILAEQKKQELEQTLHCNEISARYGLLLSEKEAEEVILYKNEVLKENKRVEFGESILPKIIETFCDSAYILQDTYAETLKELQEIFFYYKNESMDELSDDELLEFMKSQYEEICFGDLDYLKGTCLERFAREVRSGHGADIFQKREDIL